MEGENVVLFDVGEADVSEFMLEIIQNYPFLYDLGHRDYKNLIKKDQAWREIAEIINSPVDNCQRLWKGLRDRYTREKRHNKSRLGAPSTTWYYLDKMAFYEKHTKPRKYTAKRLAAAAAAAAVAKRPRSSSENSSRSPKATMEQKLSPVIFPVTVKVERTTELTSEAEPAAALELTPEISKAKEVVAAPTITKRKAKDVAEDDLVESTKKIAESISRTLEVLAGRQEQSTNANRTFTEHIYSLLEEMTPEEARDRRRIILRLMYDE